MCVFLLFLFFPFFSLLPTWNVLFLCCVSAPIWPEGKGSSRSLFDFFDFFLEFYEWGKGRMSQLTTQRLNVTINQGRSSFGWKQVGEYAPECESGKKRMVLKTEMEMEREGVDRDQKRRYLSA